MSKVFLRSLLVCLFAFSSLAVAEEKVPSEPKKLEKIEKKSEEQKPEEHKLEKLKPEEQKPGEDFFDELQAPVSYKGAFVKMMVTLLGLIVLIVISVWMLRRISHGKMKQMNYGRTIKILERRPLSAKSVLYLVEVGGKKVVVAESQLEIRTVTTADHLNPDED